MRKTCALALTLLSCALPGAIAAMDAAPPAEPRPDLQAWARVLEKYGKQGGFDYAALRKDRADLDAYLTSLAEVSPASWSKEEKMAFWINAYNALVPYHVLHLPADRETIERGDDLFTKLTSQVAGQRRTLDEIETALRDQGDPRVHFALACPVASCPGLRGEPYRAETLDAQLAAQTRDFLANPKKGLRYDPEENILHLSPIFKQYAGDFTGGSPVLALFARGGLVEWVLAYVPEELGKTLREKEPAVEYLEYDGRLNGPR